MKNFDNCKIDELSNLLYFYRDVFSVDWPSCLSTVRCNLAECRTGCPGVKDRLCLPECNCNVVFVDRKTGRTLSEKECESGTMLLNN